MVPGANLKFGLKKHFPFCESIYTKFRGVRPNNFRAEMKVMGRKLMGFKERLQAMELAIEMDSYGISEYYGISLKLTYCQRC